MITIDKFVEIGSSLGLDVSAGRDNLACLKIDGCSIAYLKNGECFSANILNILLDEQDGVIYDTDYTHDDKVYKSPFHMKKHLEKCIQHCKDIKKSIRIKRIKSI